MCKENHCQWTSLRDNLLCGWNTVLLHYGTTAFYENVKITNIDTTHLFMISVNKCSTEGLNVLFLFQQLSSISYSHDGQDEGMLGIPPL